MDNDFTRKAVLRTEKTIGQLQQRFLQYTGPRVDIKSEKEKRMEQQGQDAETTINMMNKMGPQQWDDYLKQLVYK